MIDRGQWRRQAKRCDPIGMKIKETPHVKGLIIVLDKEEEFNFQTKIVNWLKGIERKNCELNESREKARART